LRIFSTPEAATAMVHGGGARVLRRLIFLLHAIAAGACLYFMAGGFPLLHLRSLANRGLPAIVLVISLIGIYADRTARKALLHAVTTSMAAAWLVASLTGIALYPISARYLLPIGLMVALTLFLLRFKRSELPPQSSRLTFVMILVGVGVGFFVPFTQRAALATTHPIQAMIGDAPSEPASSVREISLSQNVRVAPATGSITFAMDRMVLSIDPILTFVSLSPDRCWTLFAPRELREPPERTLTAWSRADSSVRLRYADLGTSDLSVTTAGRDRAEIETTSQLPLATYSHLNTYCELSIYRHTKLSLVFSPCPNQPIDVLPMDYPVGRPARFAYLDAGGIFHAVEASSGEKGPFHELTAGKLERSQALEITFLDAGHPVASIVFADWTSQISTDLSPTAGWGVPQNAIEFSLTGESPRSAAGLFISLASTSVGRGFDTVGHAPGVYRNRMTVRLLPKFIVQ
jgi:hypothetical protein